MDTDPKTTPEALAEFNRFYSAVHVHEVIAAHPGFVGVTRYELQQPDPRSDSAHHGPRWLAIYDMQDEKAAEQYLKDNARPWLHRQKYSPWPTARRRAKTVWRMLWKQISSTGSSSESILLVGANDEPDSGAVARYQLYRAFAHPEPGAPQFVGFYDVDAAAVPNDPVWRLIYRRIESEAELG